MKSLKLTKACILLAVLSATAANCAAAGTHTWSWISGDSESKHRGIYTQQGWPDAKNMPGARREAGALTDIAGNLWLFGGYGYASEVFFDGYLNDFWKYDISSGLWIWLKGGAGINSRGTYGTKGAGAPANTPGARRGVTTWSDAGGNFWLFGGYGYGLNYSPQHLNDLWKFDTTGQGNWTWVSGSSTGNQYGIYGNLTVGDPANGPGARQSAVSWTDLDGNLWLFGGYGFGESGAVGRLNDLWKYDSTSGNWTWLKGSKTPDHAGTYGSLGSPADANSPGARYDAVSWTDASGKFWLFGGIGYGALVGEGRLNDLWRFDTQTLQWTWMKGSNIGNRPATGEIGQPNTAFTPGSRGEAVGMLDNFNNLWLFGGYGYANTAGALGHLNDSWEYKISENTWTWVAGSGNLDEPGQYGNKGEISETNVPPARKEAVAWSGADGNRWLFGGSGPAGSGETLYNDLWKASYQESSGIDWVDLSLY